MLSQLFQGVEQHAPVLFLGAGHLERGEPLGGEAKGGGGDGAGTPQLGDAGEQLLHVLDGLAAALRVESPINRSSIRQTLENTTPCSRAALRPSRRSGHSGSVQLDAVEACGGRELPLLQDALAREELLLARQLHA